MAELTTTAALAGLGALLGGAMTKLFGGDLKQYIDEIKDKLNEIEELLEDVRDGLDDLKVYIDRKFVEDAEKKLIARIGAYIEIEPSLRDTSTLDKARREEIAGAYFQEIHLARKTLCVYSYASFLTALYTMAPEQALCKAAGHPKETRLAIAKAYTDYFTACGNAAVAQTPASRRVEVSSLIAQSKSAFPDSTDRVVEAFWITPFHEITRGGRDRLDVPTGKYNIRSGHYVLSGSLDRDAVPAFTGTYYTGNGLENVPLNDPRVSHRQHISRDELVRRFNEAAARWNAAQAPYQAAKLELPVLDSTLQQIAVCVDNSKKMVALVEGE